MSKTIGFKVTEEENQILKRQAIENGMTISQYIKARLFEDRADSAKIKSKKLSDYEKDLISTAKKTFNLTYLVAENLVSKQKAQDVVEMAEAILTEKGYRNPKE